MPAMKGLFRRCGALQIVSVMVFIFLVAGLCAALAEDTSETAGLSVGYGQVDITPALGVAMPGYFNERKATGVLDPLLAKALVLTKGETTLAIVALDLIGVSRDIVGEIRRAVQDKTGIPLDHVFVHCTHTHTGGAASEIKDRLPDQVAAAVKQAMDGRVSESRVALGSSREETIAFIRRYLMKDGTVRTNPGRGNPNIVRPIGKIDPTV